MTCEQEQLIDAYHDGQLTSSQRTAFEAHLRNCPACTSSLHDLQLISQKLSEANFSQLSKSAQDRYLDAWRIANQRSILRISTWLTGAAAAALIGSLFLLPQGKSPDVAVSARPSNWELVAMMPPPERTTDRPDESIELAQWMADDLSTAAR